MHGYFVWAKQNTGKFEVEGERTTKKYFCGIYLKSYNTWSCGNSMVQQATPDLKRVQSIVRSTQWCGGPKVWWSSWPHTIPVLINPEVHIMRRSIVLDFNWSKYSSNIEVPSHEGPKTRWNAWPQLTIVLIYTKVPSWEGTLRSTEHSTLNDLGTPKSFPNNVITRGLLRYMQCSISSDLRVWNHQATKVLYSPFKLHKN